MIKLNAIVVKDSKACFNHFTSVNNTCNYWFTNLYSLEKYSPEYKRETRQKILCAEIVQIYYLEDRQDLLICYTRN